jgi:hypothetical protein
MLSNWVSHQPRGLIFSPAERIETGHVFDRAVDLDRVQEGYGAMDDREAIKVMVYAPKDRPVSASHADEARGALNKLPCRTSKNAVWAKFAEQPFYALR